MSVDVHRPDEAAPFFEACARGELIVQQCRNCGHYQFFPRRWCLECGGSSLTWEQVSGEAELVTYTVVRRAPSKAHSGRLPYAIGIVKLAEGPQMMASLVCVDLDALEPGLTVRLVPTVETGPCFAPATQGAS